MMHSQEKLTRINAPHLILCLILYMCKSFFLPQPMLMRFPEPMDPEFSPTKTLLVLPTLVLAPSPPVEKRELREEIKSFYRNSDLCNKDANI